jgi:EAL domain-containing protein (putative c-di-GMP-specific phosphodiesterase class I)
MTTHSTDHGTPASLLAPLARGLMRRNPVILSMSVHDRQGHEVWSSGDFLLAEDHALIAEVLEQPLTGEHDERAADGGLWWESSDTARARCALALREAGDFRGVLLVAFSGITAGEDDRSARLNELRSALPVLARALRLTTPEVVVAVGETHPEASMPIAADYAALSPDDTLARDLAILEREEHLVTLIDAALRNDEFELHLQPIVSLRDPRSPLIVEVLIRLPTPGHVLVSHEFLDAAERNGRMPAIDRWVIRALLVWMQRNRDRWADANAVFSVNLSGKSVVRPDFRDYVSSCLDKSGLPLTSLRFEVSEIDMGLAPQEFAALARDLLDRGCEVSVDNAGTGPGRFEFLREVNADTLKIDGSLVQGVSDDLVSRARINGLVHLADTLGMSTVASQVDSTSKLRAIRQLGVDYAQGFRVHVPEHIDAFDFVDCGIQRPLCANLPA